MIVYIVDDSTMIRVILREMLKRKGHTYKEYSTAEKALEGVSKEKPDLILLDLNIPEIGGMGFAEKIEGTIPIVMVTAETNTKRLTECAEVGVEHFLFKPFTEEGLWRKINEALKK